MIAAEAWQAFGGVLAVVVALGAGVVALQRLGVLRSSRPPAPQPPKADGLGERVARVEQAVTDLRLHVAETYTKREDWIPIASQILGKLEAQGAALARLEERSRIQEGMRGE